MIIDISIPKIRLAIRNSVSKIIGKWQGIALSILVVFLIMSLVSGFKYRFALEESEKSLFALEEIVKEQGQERDHLMSTLEEQDQERDRLMSQISVFEETIERQDQERELFASQISDLEGDVQTISADLKAREEEIDGLNDTIGNQERRISALVSQISTLMSQIEDYRKKISALGNDLPVIQEVVAPVTPEVVAPVTQEVVTPVVLGVRAYVVMAFASSQWDHQFAAMKSFDGDEVSRWSSLGIEGPHQIHIILQSERAINRLRIKPFADPSGSQIRNFTFEVMEGASWRVLLTIEASNNDEWQEWTFENTVSSRFYRIVITSNHSTHLQSSIYEIELLY